jgi:hypothetical protein
MHERLVAARYGAVKEQKLQEVLEARPTAQGWYGPNRAK